MWKTQTNRFISQVLSVVSRIVDVLDEWLIIVLQSSINYY